ncbi:class I SAM-dependent methyltransferase [Microbacterium sp. gxy059]|uniref:class I SAM-dependent methyltransferase n=1 Tax=Microbacterium sp. gxy059 TaxID=2957199 RepID=UPI003D98CA34
MATSEHGTSVHGSAAAAFDAISPRLRRRPDVEAHDLVAADASDRLALVEAERVAGPIREATVIGDRYGAIALSILAADETACVRVHQDPITGEQALRRNAAELGISLDGRLTHHPLDAGLADGAGLVILQLPRGLDALDEIAQTVAASAAEDARLVAVGRVKHMTLAMNDVLARRFREVRASRGVGKSRALHATGAVRGPVTWPREERHDDVGLVIRAHGAAFAGTSLDLGARLMIGTIPQMPDAEYAIDLGCGTGALGVSYALARHGSRVRASDRSAAAVLSARATAEANGVSDRVEVERRDALSAQPDASADLVLLNPPFHSGSAVTTAIAPRLFADAARVLRPGGELWTVWNSHLRYRPQLERIVGPTRQVARDRTFTVTASARR